MDLEIRDNEHLVCNLQSHALTISGSLQSILSTIDYIYLLHINKTNITRFKNTISSSHKHKLNSLGLPAEFKPIDSDKIIHNFSNRTLSPRENFLLSFGLEFCLPIHKPKFHTHFAAYESLASRLRPHPPYNTDFDTICDKIKHISHQNFKSKPKHHLIIFLTFLT